MADEQNIVDTNEEKITKVFLETDEESEEDFIEDDAGDEYDDEDDWEVSEDYEYEEEDDDLYDEEDEEVDDEEGPHFTPALVKEVPSMEEALSELGEAPLENEDNVEITAEDIHKSFENSMFNEDKEFDISPEDTVKLLEIIDKVRNKENINIYASLPDSVKNIITEYMKKEGVQGYSVQANR